jgi:3-oxoacyl-[acyl-carrier protein] reductase
MTRALAAELAKRNVTVNAIAPGVIETEMSQAVRNLVGDAMNKMIPLKRVGKPEEIAGLAVFLASPAADYITGQVITIDGGLSLGGIR